VLDKEKKKVLKKGQQRNVVTVIGPRDGGPLPSNEREIENQPREKFLRKKLLKD
jgi:hypothetical protein